MENVRKTIETERRYYEARVRSSNFVFRRGLEQQPDIQRQALPAAYYQPGLRKPVPSDQPEEKGITSLKFVRLPYALAALLLLPALWVMWGFFSRGGLALYFSGMELVRRDGRKASFIQCLLRGLLFWAPLVTVWALSIVFDVEYWSQWRDSDTAAGDWLMLLSWLFWWAGVVLLAVYLAFILWRPDRAWYDRVVGVWAMPR